MPLKDAFKFFLTSKKFPKEERKSIRQFTVYWDDAIIALHCRWAPSIFQQRNEIFQQIGWYPYVTGMLLEESTISLANDAMLGSRNFNALEFPDFEVNKITLQDVSVGNGSALLLQLDDFKILMDCCFDIQDRTNCPLESPPDLLYLSHAHRDHFTTLETFISRFKDIPILLSHTTLDLITYFMQGSSQLQNYLQKNAYPLIFDDMYYINDQISLQILKAGHYPGASMLYVFTMPHRLLYTGDLCLYDLQPLKGCGTGIQNLNGPLHSLIIEGRFSNETFPSQKLLLDRACEKAVKTLQNGGPVLILGDPGSWLPIFYLKLFFYLEQIRAKYRMYLDSHTLEIMRIMRARKEDITPLLIQQILRFHDPFASISRQDLTTFDFAKHSPNDPPLILFNSNQYEDPPPPFFPDIYDNPNALLIITGPIRREALFNLWSSLSYSSAAPKPLQCEVFGRYDNPKHPPFILHIDKLQIREVLRHLHPPNIYLFHEKVEKLTQFQIYFSNNLHRHYPYTELHILQPNAHFTLFDRSSDILTPPVLEELFSRFHPLIKTLEFAKEQGLDPVGFSRLGTLLTSKFPYWKDQTEVAKLSDYISEAEALGIVEILREKTEILVKLK